MTTITWKEYTFTDPFAGDVDGYGRTPEEAVADAYGDIAAADRPAYVWWTGDDGCRHKIDVPAGECVPE